MVKYGDALIAHVYIRYLCVGESFFEGAHLTIEDVVKITYFWSHKYTQDIIIHESGISYKTIVQYAHFCHKVGIDILEKLSEPIGGQGMIMEIDESKFGKRKYNCGRCVDGVWVFGGIEHDTKPPKCFFTTVPDRKRETLLLIIKRYILPGTTIHSDFWKAYDCLATEGYIHEKVNHSETFAAKNGVHTNNIESRWHAVKKSLPKYSTTKALYNSYFAEYCVRKKYMDSSQDKFLSL